MTIRKGSIVKIENTKYKELPQFVNGVIEEINPKWQPASMRVKVIGFANERSETKDFYFELKDITDVEDTETDVVSLYPNTAARQLMYGLSNTLATDIENYYKKKKENKIMEQLIKGYKTIIIDYNVTSAKAFACYDDSIKEGDAVLCMDGTTEIKGIVRKIFADDAEKPEVKYLREVICKIDYSAYHDRVERRAKIAKLKAAMAKKKEELNELAVYQALAATSPEMADMLKELKDLL